MTRLQVTIGWLTALVLSRIADFATTYHFTPDLSEEANPLVHIFGGHWNTLLLVNLLVCGVAAACTILTYRAAPRSDLLPLATSGWDFASLLMYGEVLPKSVFIKNRLFSPRLPPKRQRSAILHLVGFCSPRIITSASLLAVFLWFATRQWKLEWVITLHEQLGVFLVVIPIVLLWILAESQYFTSEYKRACQHHQKSATHPIEGQL